MLYKIVDGHLQLCLQSRTGLVTYRKYFGPHISHSFIINQLFVENFKVHTISCVSIRGPVDGYVEMGWDANS